MWAKLQSARKGWDVLVAALAVLAVLGGRAVLWDTLGFDRDLSYLQTIVLTYPLALAVIILAILWFKGENITIGTFIFIIFGTLVLAAVIDVGSGRQVLHYFEHHSNDIPLIPQTALLGAMLEILAGYMQIYQWHDFASSVIIGVFLAWLLAGRGNPLTLRTRNLDQAMHIQQITAGQQELDRAEDQYGSSSIEVADALDKLAYAYAEADRPAEAVPLLERSIGICEGAVGVGARAEWYERVFLVRVYLESGCVDRAVDTFARVVTDSGFASSETQTFCQHLTEAYQRSGQLTQFILVAERLTC